MATEYKDGTFGETLPFDDAMEEFLEACEDGTAKALHVGSYDEVELKKAREDFLRDIQKSMEELNDRLADIDEDLEEQEKESLTKKPTAIQIEKILKNGN
jgi:hypothetical protein